MWKCPVLKQILRPCVLPFQGCDKALCFPPVYGALIYSFLHNWAQSKGYWWNVRIMSITKHIYSSYVFSIRGISHMKCWGHMLSPMIQAWCKTSFLVKLHKDHPLIDAHNNDLNLLKSLLLHYQYWLFSNHWSFSLPVYDYFGERSLWDYGRGITKIFCFSLFLFSRGQDYNFVKGLLVP